MPLRPSDAALHVARTYEVVESTRSRASARDSSTTSGAGNEPGGDAAASTTAHPVPLVKVGKEGRFLPFSAVGLMGKNISELLEALAFSKLFGLKSKDIDLSGCSVAVFKGKLAEGKKVPADDAKFVELEGADTIDSITKGIDEGNQICIRVGLPSARAAALAQLEQDVWLRNRSDNICLLDATVVRRTDKCQYIFDELTKQPVRLLRSPPASGKTSLAALLKHYAADAGIGREVTVLDASSWVAECKSLEDFWLAETGEVMGMALKPTDGPLRTFIIDEAQRLYRLGQDHPFWSAVKAINAAGTSRVQVLLLGVYGLHARDDQVGMPIEIRDPWSLSLLELDDAETESMFAAFNATCGKRGCPPLSPELQLAMQRICGRHVGLLRDCVILYWDSFKGKPAPTLEEEAEFTATRLLRLGASYNRRALPLLSDLAPAEAAAIMRVTLAGEAGLQLEDLELIAFPRKLITTGVFDMAPAPCGAAVLRFASPAMRTNVLRQLFGARPQVLIPAEAFASAATLARHIVKRMQQVDLRGSQSPAAEGSLLERQYQMSFYAAAVAALPRNVSISPDYGEAHQPGSDTRGYVDFYINGKHNIGIELTRDGQKLQVHAERFGSQGRYAVLKLKSWIVVDFRQTTPQGGTISKNPNCLFVVFSKDFSHATLMQHGHRDETVHLRSA